MNLPAFLKQVDDLCSPLSAEQLRSIIHEVARKLPEAERKTFLKILSGSFGEETAGGADSADEDIVKDISDSLQALEKIDDGEAALDSEFNERYDEWYNSEEDEFIFLDPDGLLPDIIHAVSLIHTCVDQEKYQDGFTLAEALSALSIRAEGDYSECMDEEMDISDLYENDLLNGSEDDLVRESAFLAYMGNKLEERAEAMISIIQNYQNYNVTLEQILQTGNHALPDFKEFLSQWIDVLGKGTGYYCQKYLEEAQSMLTDRHEMLENARKYTDTHPELYLYILKQGRDAYDADEIGEMFSVGTEAMERIPENLRVRGDIALLTAYFVYKMNKPDPGALKYCWMEAFRSNTTVVNFLRLRLYDPAWKNLSKEIRSVYEDVYRRSPHSPYSFYPSNTLPQNTLSGSEYCWLLFWDRRFEDVIKTGMNTKEALGWSNTFMKSGLAAFLLLLYQGLDLPEGLTVMLERTCDSCGFSQQDFAKGMDEKIFYIFTGTHLSDSADEDDPDDGDSRLFWILLQQWKNEFTVSDEWIKQMLQKLHFWIALRTAGILKAQRRNYYGECAAFIAAYGEVLESLGQAGARRNLMKQYRQEYPRHLAFRRELRCFEPGI